MLLTVSLRFSRAIIRTFAMFSSVLLVSGRPNLSSSVTLSKNVSPTCKPLFSSWHYPRKLALTSTSTNNKKFNVRSLLQFKLRHSRGGTQKHTQTVIDATQKETAIDQQQHSCETLIYQRHQTVQKLLSSAATASTRWRVRELYCTTTYFNFSTFSFKIYKYTYMYTGVYLSEQEYYDLFTGHQFFAINSRREN